MRHWIRSLPLAVELIVVIGAGFGYFAVSSVAGLLSARPPTVTADDILFLLVYEPVVWLTLFGLLWIRGWQWRDFNVRISAWQTFVGLILATVAYLAAIVASQLAATLLPDLYAAISPPRVAELPAVLAISVSLVNAVYEETLVLAYLVRRLEQPGRYWWIFNISLALRLVYHLYQGPLVLITVLPIGALFTWWYLRTRMLWPVIVAHALIDVIALWLAR